MGKKMSKCRKEYIKLENARGKLDRIQEQIFAYCYSVEVSPLKQFISEKRDHNWLSHILNITEACQTFPTNNVLVCKRLHDFPRQIFKSDN